MATGLYISVLAVWLVRRSSHAPPDELELPRLGLFVGAGTVTAGLGRLFLDPGNRLPGSVGSRTNTELGFSDRSFIVGLLSFSESLGPLKLTGAAVIAIGVWSVSRPRDGVAGPSELSATPANIMFPVLAGLAITAGDALRKRG